MAAHAYSEDTLVQQTTAEYLERQLGWESVYAYNNEDFGPGSLLGRASDREVVLTRYPAREARRAESRACPTRPTTTPCGRSSPSPPRRRSDRHQPGEVRH